MPVFNSEILDAITGQFYCVDEVEPALFQSIFPEPLSHKSSLHPTESEAWDHISNVMEGFE